VKVSFDTSAFAKRYINENGSDQIDELCQQASRIGLSIITPIELLSALNRLMREKSITSDEYMQIKRVFAQEIEGIDICNISNEVVQESITLLEFNSLRSLDAMHIAAAKIWGADKFVTADKRQWQAAKDSGLSTILINSEILN